MSRWSWWSRWRAGGAGANSLVAHLVVELVVQPAGGLLGGLVGRLVDEAVGSGMAAVLHVDGELGGVQRLQDAVHVKAESEGVCWQPSSGGERGGVLTATSGVKFSR